MNRDEILMKLRNSKQSTDEYEIHIQLRAARISKAVGVAIAFLLVFIDEIWFGNPAIGWTALTIAFGMNTVEDWMVLIMTRRKTLWFSTLLDTLLWIGSGIALLQAIL